MNPMIPDTLDVALATAVILHTVLAAVALTVVIARRRTAGLLGSLLLILLVPVAGPVLWLAHERTVVRGRVAPRPQKPNRPRATVTRRRG